MAVISNDTLVALSTVVAIAAPITMTTLRVGKIVQKLEHLATLVGDHLESHVRWEQRLNEMQRELWTLQANFNTEYSKPRSRKS